MADEEYLNDGAEASADGPRLNALDRKITLSGRPKLVIYSEEAAHAPLGN